MERYNFQFADLFVLVCLTAFVLAVPSYAQFTPEQEAKINAAADSAARVAANLPPNEKKIAWFILERINRMIKEQAKSHPNPEKKYSTRGFPVDKSSRVLVNVALLRGSAKSDTNIVVDKIRTFGGAVKTISNPLSDYPIEIYCWLPYDTVKAIAKLQKVASISSIGIGTTWTVCETTIGDMQLLADQARAYFNVDGSGIKVGVISDGIQHASVSQACGDLPSFLQTVNGNTPGDEGTAMLEIVYDLAPGCNLAFGGINLDGTDGPNRHYYVVGSGIYEKERLSDSAWKNNPRDITTYYTDAVRGNHQKDVFIVGSFGEVLHYNGVSWQSYKSETALTNGTFGSVEVKGDWVVAAGFDGAQAVILVGKRQE